MGTEKDVTLAAICYPDSKQADIDFFDELSSLLVTLATFGIGVVITGDLNIRVEKADDVNKQRLMEALDTFELSQHVQDPTQIRVIYLT